MPQTYFHVDRLNRLSEGKQIKFLFTRAELAKIGTNRADMIATLFPDGLSYHGQRYLIDSRAQPVEDKDGQVEVIAEFVRRSRFPKRPSRYQSLFACRSIDDALRFKQEYGNRAPENSGSEMGIWEVETKRPVHVGDLRFLDLGECWSECFVYLDKYWRQEINTNNPLIEVLLPLPVRVVRKVE